MEALKESIEKYSSIATVRLRLCDLDLLLDHAVIPSDIKARFVANAKEQLEKQADADDVSSV